MNHFVLAYGGSGPLFEVKANGRADRVFKPDEDHYPAPLMSSQPSYKMSGMELQMAVCYFQYARIRQLVQQHQHEDVPALFMANIDTHLAPRWHKYGDGKTYDEFKHDLLRKYPTYDQIVHNYGHAEGLVDVFPRPVHSVYHILCGLVGANMSSNVPYERNEYIWNRTLETLLNAYTPDNLGRLMATLGDISPVVVAMREKRPLAALVLIHYGCPLPDDAEQVLGKALCARVAHALTADLPNGQRLRPLAAGECGITLAPIERPVLLGDGHVYEREAALRWLSKSYNSPLFGTPLSEHWFGFDLDENRFVYADYAADAGKRKTLGIDFSNLIK